MLKKYTAILFITVAYAIMIGHSIVPHHHHDSIADLNEHHHAHHCHDGDEESNSLSHLFSHFVHSDDGFTLITKHNTGNNFFKQLVSIVAILPDNFSLSEVAIPHFLHKPPSEHLVYISPHSHPSGLRAPPAVYI